MTESRRCSECGTDIMYTSGHELCSACLLKLGLGSSPAAVGGAEGSLEGTRTSASVLSSGIRIRYVGDYELIEEVGRGGMGVVYKARQLSLNRIVAVKMMLPGLLSSEAEVQRFLTEAEAAANLQHANIVAIHEVGEHNDLHYFSMDYVEGKNLAELGEDGPLPVRTAARYVRTIAEAIHFAHEMGILHRDLKPANVLIDANDQPRITDFGLARRIMNDAQLTLTGIVLGTPAYMPPEQVENRRPEIGPASDVYSLGALLYELVTACPPFQAATPLDTLKAVLHSDPVSPRSLNPKLDRDLQTICLKCLRKDPKERYNSAQDLAADLDRYLNREPIEARPLGVTRRALRWCRRNPSRAAALVAITVLAAAAGSLWATTVRERTWQSLVERARSEQNAGRREESLELIAEAAQIKRTPELRQDAINTITAGGLRLVHDFEFGDVKGKAFSPDGSLLAVSGLEQLNPYSGEGAGSLSVWEMESGKRLARTMCSSWPGSFAFSPVSSLIALSQFRGHLNTTYPQVPDENIILWNPSTGEETKYIKHEEQSLVEGCARFELVRRAGVGFAAPPTITFSPAGAHLAKVDSYNKAVWVLDVTSGSSKTHCIQSDVFPSETPRGYHSRSTIPESTASVFLSNQEILIDCDEGTRRLNVTTNRRGWLARKGLWALSVSADRRIALLSPHRNVPIVVWDLSTDRQVGLLPPIDLRGGYPPNAILSSDGHMAAIQEVGAANIIRIVDVGRLKADATDFDQRLITLSSNSQPQFGEAAFSPDGSLLAVSVKEGSENTVGIFDAKSARVIAQLRDNVSPVWSSDGKSLATTAMKSGDIYGPRTVRVWEVVLPPPTFRFDREPALSLAFGPNDEWLIANHGSTSGSDIANFLGVARAHGRMEMRPTSPILATMVREAYARSNPEDFRSRGGQGIGIGGGTRVLVVGDQLWALNLASPLLWQLAPEKQRIELGIDQDALLRRDWGSRMPLAISPDGKTVLMSRPEWPQTTGDLRGILEVWSLVSGKRIDVWNDGAFFPVSGVTFSPDGATVATWGENTRHLKPTGVVDHIDWFVQTWDAATGKMIRRIEPGFRIKWAVFSPDSRLIVCRAFGSSTQDDQIAVCDGVTGRRVATWSTRQGRRESENSDNTPNTLSPDGRVLATGGQDGTICFWRVSDGLELARWNAHENALSALAFTKDGSTLASGGSDGTLILWDLSLIKRELSRVGLGW